VICLLADSYVEPCQEAGSAAELAATRKLAKYSALWTQYDFQPVAMETLGPLNESACEFLNIRGRKIGTKQTTIRQQAFCFNGFLFWFSALMWFC